MTAAATLERLASNQHLDAESAQALLGQLLDASTPEPLIAGILTALRTKGESGEELLGITRALLDVAAPVVGVPAGAIDTCGTGGDGAQTFNISTAAALVVTACSVPVVKHGNRSVTSRSGSADVIEALGLPFAKPAEPLADARFAFLFAPQFHPALKRIGPVRKALGIRTVFNLVGPLANPARPDFQLMGVASRERLPDVARALQGLGRKRAFVVHGEPGLDEATPAGRFTVVDVRPDTITAADFTAADFGLAACGVSDLRGGDATENAAIIQQVFNGNTGPRRDVVVLNAALALLLAGKAATPAQAAALAANAIDSGAAFALLESLKK
ncbi:MAG: anthranilate phosphoribosyltransferase [Planctomycetes bacterium]|nr:anthranilate phosphoribosyltransferase [Planctomycetota bacterium]MCW8136418.1 anthranilate phosphoribosyltransferase [Planctomycetota bacterium]